MILNIKKFNKFLKVRNCKLKSIEIALHRVRDGCYFASVDIIASPSISDFKTI